MLLHDRNIIGASSEIFGKSPKTSSVVYRVVTNWYKQLEYDILTCEDIDDFTVLTFVGVSSKHLWVFLESPRQSSEIFGYLQKFSENVRERSSGLQNNFKKSSESGRKSSENHQKRRHQYVYIIKRTLHVSSKIWILCSRGKNNISLVCCVRS